MAAGKHTAYKCSSKGVKESGAEVLDVHHNVRPSKRERDDIGGVSITGLGADAVLLHGAPAEPESRTENVTIRRLREKLEDAYKEGSAVLRCLHWGC